MSITESLEKSIMKVWKKPISQNRRAMRTAALAMLSVALAGGVFAGSHFLGDGVCGPFSMDADGMVLHADGDTVGGTELHADGKAITTIHSENLVMFLDCSDQTEGVFSIPFQAIED